MFIYCWSDVGVSLHWRMCDGLYTHTCMSTSFDLKKKIASAIWPAGAGFTNFWALAVYREVNCQDLDDFPRLFTIILLLVHVWDLLGNLLGTVWDMFCILFISEENGKPHKHKTHWEINHARDISSSVRRFHCTYTYANLKSIQCGPIIREPWIRLVISLCHTFKVLLIKAYYATVLVLCTWNAFEILFYLSLVLRSGHLTATGQVLQNILYKSWVKIPSKGQELPIKRQFPLFGTSFLKGAITSLLLHQQSIFTVQLQL